MTKRIGCSDLGIANCDFEVDGEAVDGVMREAVHHLRKKHNINLPDADAILAGYMSDDPFDGLDPAVVLVIRRLREALEVEPLSDPSTGPRVFPVDTPKLNLPSSRGDLTR